MKHRPARSAALAAALGTAALLAAQPAMGASGDVAHYNVHVGAGAEKLSCSTLLPEAGNGIECRGGSLPVRDAGVTVVKLGPRGKATVALRSDAAYSSKQSQPLRPSQVWRPLHAKGRKGGIACALERRGTVLSCNNRDAHGFRLSAASLRRF